MKTKFVILLVLIGSTLMVSAVPVKPVIIAQKGQPIAVTNGASASLQPRQSLPAGTIIETDKDSKIAIAVAPGQMISLGNKGKLKIISIHDAAADKGAVVEVLLGSASCYIDPKHGHSGPVFELVAGKESIKAKGTTWTTSVSGGGTVSTTVTSSAVTVTTAGGGASFPVPAGAVVTSTYAADGSYSGSVVVNLTTGTATVIGADGASSSGPASAAQLGAAAASFQAAVNSAVSSPSGAESAAVVALVAAVNVTLSAAGLPTVTTDGAAAGAGFQDTGSSARDTATASPENP